MKKIFFSLAAVICFAVSASAQSEVRSAVNNNSNASDENVNGTTKMDMRPGMRSVIQNQTLEGAKVVTPDDNTQVGAPDANTNTDNSLLYKTDQSRGGSKAGARTNSGAVPANTNTNKR